MKNRRESGEVVVEASIVVTLVMVFITIMLYIGMVLYQRTLVSVMANQTASNIAQVYSNTLKDPFTGYIDSDKVYQSITYSNMKTDAYLDVVEQKASVFAKYRLKSSRILATGNATVDVQVIKKPNELLKSQIVVTIRDKCDLPLVGVFEANGLVEFEATGRADCVDYLEYLMGVEAIGDPENSPIPSLPNSDTCLVTFVTDKYSSGFHATVPVLRGKTIITSNPYSHSEMPMEPRLNDMKFTGWVLEDGTEFTATKQIDENVTVYGSWQCKITFDADGGNVSPTEKFVEYMKTAEFPNPNREGYSFQGWYTEQEGAGEAYVSNRTQITKNITLYAKWECTHEGAMVKATSPVNAGNCRTRSIWQYTCSRCKYPENREGAFGDHIKSNSWRMIKSSTCIENGIEIEECAVLGCSAVVDSREIGLADCSFVGRCGTTHEFKNNIEDSCTCIGAEAGEFHSSITIDACKGKTYRKFQCIVCLWCGRFETKNTTGNVSNESKTLSDGTTLYSSDHVWCWEHHPSFKDIIPEVPLRDEHKITK